MYVLSNGEILNWANTIDELTSKIQKLDLELRAKRKQYSDLYEKVRLHRGVEAKSSSITEQSSTTEPASPPEGLEEEMQDWDRQSKTAALPETWEEDLLEFYPPEELQDWKQGFAAMKCSMLELDEQVQMLQKEIMVMGMTPQKRPQDELSIEDED